MLSNNLFPMPMPRYEWIVWPLIKIAEQPVDEVTANLLFDVFNHSMIHLSTYDLPVPGLPVKKILQLSLTA
jgi:hypothetical protein